MTRIWASIASVLAAIVGILVAVLVPAGAAGAVPTATEAAPPPGALIVYNGFSQDIPALPPACTNAPYKKIQDAVDAAKANDTIYVCASMYPEAVNLSKPLILLGAQNGVPTSGRTTPADETTVDAPQSMGSDFTYTGTNTAGVINGFTLLGNGQGTANVGFNDGIMATNGGPGGFIWSYNLIEHTQTGIAFDSLGVGQTGIENNKIINNNEAVSSTTGNNGIVFTNGPTSNVLITGNDFAGQAEDINTTGSNTAGVLSSGVRVDLNTSTNSDSFIGLVYTFSAQVTRNVISDPNDNAPASSSAIGVLGDDTSPMVSGNKVTTGQGAGIRVDEGSTGSPSTGVVISQNAVSNRNDGISLDANNPLDKTSSVTDNIVSDNQNNGIYVQAGSGVMVNKNVARGNSVNDCIDQTHGNGTASTANTWAGDVGVNSSPVGICFNASSYVPVAPTRVCDTRSGNPSGLTFPADQCNQLGALQSGKTLGINVAGQFGVPSGATAVVLNVTSVNPSGEGFVTAYPAWPGAAPPTASNLNVRPGQNVANLVTVDLNATGAVSFTGNVNTDLVVDLEGYFLQGGGADLYQPAPAQRVCDTRAGNPSNLVGTAAACNGQKLAAGGSRTISLSGLLPANADAVVANVTAVNASSAGFLSVYPSSGSRPVASNVSFGPGQTIPNRVTVKVGSANAITVYANQPTDIVVDIDGWYSKAGSSASGSLFVPHDPLRICDTRVQNPSFLGEDQAQCNSNTLQPGGTLNVLLGGLFRVPSDATAATLNVTGVQPSTLTYLTVFPKAPVPGVSDLNPGPGQIEPNMTITALAGDGSFDIFNHTGMVDAVVDLNGFYLPASDLSTGV